MKHVDLLLHVKVKYSSHNIPDQITKGIQVVEEVYVQPIMYASVSKLQPLVISTVLEENES